MREPVRILSDLHLGHKVSRVEQVESLRPLIAGAGTVVFNGDTWQELLAPMRERSAAMLAELRAICTEEGVDTVFLSGNHDPGWPGDGWISLARGRIIVTHGDTLPFDGSPWKREILAGSARVTELWTQHPNAETDVSERVKLAREMSRALCSVEISRGRSFLQRAFDAACPPKRAIKILQAWFTQPSAGEAFCSRYFPSAEFLILGHFHRQGCWLRGGRRIINTGSFMNPGRAHWVEWNQGRLSRGVINESPTHCRIGKTLGLWKLDDS